MPQTNKELAFQNIIALIKAKIQCLETLTS